MVASGRPEGEADEHEDPLRHQRLRADIRTEIVDQFGVASVDDSLTHFLSLLYFLGMLKVLFRPWQLGAKPEPAKPKKAPRRP